MKTLLSIFSLCYVTLNYGQNLSIERLENSPRHHEWVKIDVNDRTLHSFVVYPQESKKTLSIILIHENRGLNDWARSMADQIAEMGYIVIAPDLLSGRGPNGGKTSDFETSDQARNAIYELDADQVTADLNAVYEYVKTLTASNGKVAVIGFCWGGSQSFRFASNNNGLEAAFVCYGGAPNEVEDIAKIATNIYGFYGGNDARISAGIPDTEKIMKEQGKFYEPIIYEGAGHGFFRAGEMDDATEENKKAREQGLNRLKNILAELN